MYDIIDARCYHEVDCCILCAAIIHYHNRLSQHLECLDNLCDSQERTHIILLPGSSLIYGYKVMLQLLAFQNPKITISNIQKVTTLRNSYQNRQPVLLAILWALGQGGMKDLQTGLKGRYFNLKF